MLDEIDKVAATSRRSCIGIARSSRSEQNSTFRDNYLDVTFDLSKVLFITTANMLDPIAEPLRDRMRSSNSGLHGRRVHISFQYLIPRQIEARNWEQIEFPPSR